MRFDTLPTAVAILFLLVAPPFAAEDARADRAAKIRTIETKGSTRDLSPPVSRTKKTDAKKLQRALRGLEPADALASEMAQLGRQLQALQKGSRGERAAARKTAAKIQKLAGDLQRGFAGFDVPEAKSAKGTLAKLSNTIDDMMKDLESEDRLGNFEIQRLMSRYNQAEQLASQVQKKKDDTEKSVIDKIG